MKGIYEFLYPQGRIDLSRTLPAGNDFFSALAYFRNSAYNYIIRVSDNAGNSYVTLQGLENRNATDFPKITEQWRAAALYLARMYREKVIGQQSQ